MATRPTRNLASRTSDLAFSRQNLQNETTEPDVRIQRLSTSTMCNWKDLSSYSSTKGQKNIVLECGWGRLLFGQTFNSAEDLIEEILAERTGTRDLAFYVRDPHILVSLAPNIVFLDPSHTFRIWLDQYRPATNPSSLIFVRRIFQKSDIESANRILLSRQMVPLDAEFLWKKRNSRALIPIVAESVSSGEIVGICVGVDHPNVFQDPENGASLWSLAVDPQVNIPGVGESLSRFLIEYFQVRGRAYMDLSVMHTNTEAISFYKKLGFQRIPVYSIKRRNEINEKLFTPRPLEEKLNPYAKLITTEAKRRGIFVRVIDTEKAIFELSNGGRNIICQESLTSLTSSLSYIFCQDKRLTRKILANAGLTVTTQRLSGTPEENSAFLNLHRRVVVKPLLGEQGRGISVDIRDEDSLERSIRFAKKICDEVLLEEMVDGIDLRLVVINFSLVAAAIRIPAEIVGDGQHMIRQLIQKASRRRSAATGGESKIPIDD
ncbi:MAG: N-acetylglutaminylglutamine synthetase, partial [Bdellovibrionales bacterium]|nr:N-acetylglutaminylglutamine synthetase [Bdellovibrionales bacterium]